MGYSYSDVASVLKINPDYVKGLEEYNIEIFPAPVFFKGFLKNYVKFLGLNEAEIISAFLAITGSEDKENERVLVSDKKALSLKKQWLKYGVLFFIIFLMLFSWLRVAYINYQKKSELEKRLSSNFNTLTTAKELALQEEKKRIIGQAKKEDVVKIKTHDNCWVEIKFQDTKIFQGLLLGGDEREFEYKKGMVIKVGNAGAIELNIRGEVKKDLGKKGEVKEIVLD